MPKTLLKKEVKLWERYAPRDVRAIQGWSSECPTGRESGGVYKGIGVKARIPPPHRSEMAGFGSLLRGRDVELKGNGAELRVIPIRRIQYFQKKLIA